MESVLTVLVVLTVFTTVTSAQDPFCVPAEPNPSTNGPSLPPLPDTFQTRIEANFLNPGVTMDVEEYFDDTGNRGAVTTKISGYETFMIFSYETNELFTGSLDDMSCVTTNLTGDTNNFVFGVSNDQGQPHIFTTNGALKFGSQYAETYLGQTTIRGIPVDHWQSCINWKLTNTYFTVDYYFTLANWTNPYGIPRTPVRAWVQGIVTNDDNTKKPFNHYYDYFGFIPGIADETVFETPKGIVCPNRVVTMDVPQLAGQFSYRQEIISPDYGSISIADVWYDSNYKLVRYDYRNEVPAAPFFSTNPMTEIHDYNTGVAYGIDKINGNCSMKALENSTFDVTLKFSQQSYVEQMRTGQSLFYLDYSYSYEGQRTIAGIVCDVFVSRRTDFQIGDGPVNTTFEYYFLSNDWTEVAQNGLDEDSAVPVRLEISSIDAEYHAQYNFFAFDQEHPDLSNFDITACFDEDSTKNIEIKFPGNFDDIVDHLKFFELSARLTIAELSTMSPIRVQHSSVKHTTESILYYATLLAHPPTSAKFHKFSGVVLEYNNDKEMDDVVNEDDCSYLCLTEPSFDCLSFDLCPQKRKCYLSKAFTDEGTLIDNDKCSHYSLNVGSGTSNEIELSDGFTQLKNNLYRNQFSIVLPLGNGDDITFLASGIRENIILPDEASQQELTGDDNIKQFYPLRNYMFLGNADNVLTGVSVDDCATSCVTEDLFVCQSFEYSFVNGDCQLSSKHPGQNIRLMLRSQITDLYIRTYTYKFTKVPGVVMLGQSDMIYQKVRYPSQCARLCVGLGEFPCKSFDFCGDEQACVLGRKHMLDIPEANKQADPSCDHYSRSYFDDFKKLSGKAVALKNNMIVEGLTLMECAKLCSEGGDSCMGFDFCGNDTFCRITSDSIKNIGQVTVQSVSYCDHYARQYYTDGSKVTSYSLQNTQDPSLKFSSGSMTGLAFGMILLGCLLTVGLAIGITKYRARGDTAPPKP